MRLRYGAHLADDRRSVIGQSLLSLRKTEMTSIAIVLYIRPGESFPTQLLPLIIDLTARYSIKLFLFSELDCTIPSEITFAVQQFRTMGTKYVKLNEIIKQDNSEYLISLDNDIIPHLATALLFIETTIAREDDVAWAQIAALPVPGLISRLVAIDKLLSHRVIRPILWQYGLGISIPGQFFILKRELFSGKLYKINTFLDDLALGLYVNQHRYMLQMQYFKQVVAYEKPNETFRGLCAQRRRWAVGYKSVMQMAKMPGGRALVIIHGFAYHGLWLVHLLVALGLWFISPVLACTYLLGTTLLCCTLDLKYFGDGLLYQFIFPIFHLVWWYALIVGQREYTYGKMP